MSLIAPLPASPLYRLDLAYETLAAYDEDARVELGGGGVFVRSETPPPEGSRFVLQLMQPETRINDILQVDSSPFNEEQVDFYDVVEQELVDSRAIEVDASPVLRDFNQDGCTDILWFTPERLNSRLWSSNCQGNFLSSFVQPPLGAYPLGYGLGHGRD